MKKLAEGCCSSVAPCDHQKRSPYTVCTVCKQAASEEAKGNLVFRDATGKPAVVLDLSNL